jgi:hypothetical protein
MTALVPRQREWTFQYIVAELPFIPATSNWLKLLPGCFQQAQAAQRNSNTIKGNLLFCLCALFGLLTLITLASFIWHFSIIFSESTFIAPFRHDTASAFEYPQRTD